MAAAGRTGGGVGEPRWGPDTQAVRAGQHQFVDDQHSEPLVLTSSYIFDDAYDAAEKFAARRPGNVYVRFTNPTVRAFEERIAAMEQAEDAVGTSSGMAAYLAVSLALLQQGDHVLLAEGVFGTTTKLYLGYLEKFGIATTVLDVTDTRAWSRELRPETRMFVVETPTNPLMKVADIRALAALAHAHGALLVVDNTLCTPVLQQPVSLGADLVLHSAGKYIDGQGRCAGGVVVGRKELIAEVNGVLRTLGPSLSPFNAWLLLKSLETLPLRMRAHSEAAGRVCTWLESREDVARVHWTGSAAHPQRQLVSTQQFGHGGLLSFEMSGGQDAAWTFIDNLRLISNTTNIGDTKSMITHPGTTTHGRLSQEAKRSAGIGGGLLRLSVGLENTEDLLADLAGAFRASAAIPAAVV
jgi:O-succinylhomoserine sulfhydrylase